MSPDAEDPPEPVEVKPVSAVFDLELTEEESRFLEQYVRDNDNKIDDIDREFYHDTIGG